jgi:hypothetical protein
MHLPPDALALPARRYRDVHDLQAHRTEPALGGWLTQRACYLISPPVTWPGERIPASCPSPPRAVTNRKPSRSLA